MPTANRRAFVPAAIEMFLRQTYADKELIIVDDGEDPVADLIPHDASVRYIREARRLSVGDKRNLACEAARGDVVLHWDDDDWYAPWRVSYQVDQLTRAKLELCGLNHALFVDAAAREAWEFEKPLGLIGATFGYPRSLWRTHPFPNSNIGEDTAFWHSAENHRREALQDNRFFVCRIHRSNTITQSPRMPHGSGSIHPWAHLEVRDVRRLLGPDWKKYFGGKLGLPMGSVPDPPRPDLIWFYF